MTQTALVTGASSGIGAEFARQLAARRYNLVLVARSAAPMHDLAAVLHRDHGVRIEVLPQDLAAPDAASRIVDHLRTHRLSIDMLVNNAGFGTCGRFEEIPLDRDHDQLMVNVVSLVDLTHALVPDMVARGRGAVVNVGSTAGFQPTPYFAVYGAAKTFVLDFSLALWSEYRKRGVKVLALCPGPVETRFFEVIGTRKAAVGLMETPERVVAQTFRALDRNQGYVVPGATNVLSAHLQPRRPRKLVALISHAVTRRVLVAS